MDYDNSSSLGTFDHSANPDSVEAIIDACRLSCDWDGVLNGIKKYAHIFDVGSANSSYQHANIDAVRAYYWVCMGEALYALNGDFNYAIDCAKRAMSIDQFCVEARIIIARVLLDNCATALRVQKGACDTKKSTTDLILDVDAHGILSELLKTLTKMDQKIIIEAVCGFDRKVQNVLLASIGALEVSEGLSICTEMLEAIQIEKIPTEDIPKYFVLVTAKYLLLRIDLSDIVAKYYSRCLSEYRYWIFLDAVASRMMILHHLGQSQHATSEALFLLTTVLPSEDVARNSSFVSFSSIPEICRNIVLCTACRLPLFERNLDLLEESLESFHRCVSSNSVLKHYFPLPIQLGLNVETALSMLLRARGRHHTMIAAAHTQAENVNGKNIRDLVLDYASANSEIKTDIDNAFSLLSVAQNLLTSRTDPEQTLPPSQYPKGLTPLPNSLLNSLPLSAYEPELYASSGSSSTIGALMAAVIRLRDSSSYATGQSVSILEWAISLEIRPKANLLYSLAGVCRDGGRWEHAIELLEQCHYTLITQDRELELDQESVLSGSPSSLWEGSAFCVGMLLSWMGAGRSPTAPNDRWLPLARASEICLESLDDPQRARNFTRRCLLECYGEKGLILLKKFKSDEAAAIQKKKLFSIEMHSENTLPPFEYLSIDMPLFAEGLSYGEVNLLFLLGKIHYSWSILSSTTDSEKNVHINSAAIIFDILVQHSTRSKFVEFVDCSSGNHSPNGPLSVLRRSLGFSNDEKKKEKDRMDEYDTLQLSCDADEEFSRELSLRYAICLAENNEIHKAITYVRDALRTSEFHSNSQMLHLLALLTSSTGDDTQTIGNAAALAKVASETSPFHDLVRDSSSPRSLLTTPDRRGSTKMEKFIIPSNNLTSSTRSDREDKESLRGRDEEYIDKDDFYGAEYSSPTGRMDLNENSSHAAAILQFSKATLSPNALLTLTMFEWIVCGNSTPLHAIDFIVDSALNDFRSIMEFQNSVREQHIIATAKIKKERKSLHLSGRLSMEHKSEQVHQVNSGNENQPVLPQDKYDRTDNPRSVRSIIEVLLVCSRIYRKADKLNEARNCLESGWRLLFNPLRDAMYGICDILQDVEGNTSEHKRIDLLRHVPTLTGWKLSEAAGWGCRSYPDLEAEILCEASFLSDKISVSRELLVLSITLCGHCVPALLALANMELDILERNNDNNRSQDNTEINRMYSNICQNNSDQNVCENNCSKESGKKHNNQEINENITSREEKTNLQTESTQTHSPSLYGDSQAYGFAMAAVRASDRNPECWQCLGRVYQFFGMFLEASEAYSSALELVKYAPIRPFSTVLTDGFIKPTSEVAKKGR